MIGQSGEEGDMGVQLDLTGTIDDEVIVFVWTELIFQPVQIVQ